MDRFLERIGASAVLGLDTAIFIYHFENNPRYQPFTSAILSGIETGRFNGVTSAITLMEILVQPLRLGERYAAREYEALLVNLPNLKLIDLDRNIIRQAAQLRAEFHLRPPDALQVSACLAGGAKTIITNDHFLARLKSQIDIVILDDFIFTKNHETD